MMKNKSKIFGLRYLERTREARILGGQSGPTNGMDIGTYGPNGDDTKHRADSELRAVMMLEYQAN